MIQLGLPLLKLFLAFPIVVFLMFLLKKSLERVGPSFGGTKNMKLIEQLRLSPKTTIVIVEVEGERILLGCADGQVSMLKELPQKEM